MVNNISTLQYRIFFEIGNLIIVCIIAGFILRYKIVDFEYIIKDDIFYIKRIMGRREVLLLEIPIKNIKYIGRDNVTVKKYSINKRYNFRASFRKLNVYHCIYKEHNLYYLVEFEPSEKLISIINNRGLK
jgi:hypothetical protein